MKSLIMDEKMQDLLRLVQEGIKINARPYSDLGNRIGLSEEEVISRLTELRKSGLLKRMDISIDMKKLGFRSALVACRISKKDISNAKKVLDTYGNITHNYLRKHRLNMWFTLSAMSKQKLDQELVKIKNSLKPKEIVSLPTEKVYKLKLQLHAH